MPGAGNTNATDTYQPRILVVKRGTAVVWLNTGPGMVQYLRGDAGAFQFALMRQDQGWSARQIPISVSRWGLKRWS